MSHASHDGSANGWQHFPHAADIGVRGTGASLAAAFEQAALALTAVIVDPKRVRQRQPVAIACEAGDVDLLLVAWLNAVVFEMATRSMLFGRYDVTIDGKALRATAWGEPVDLARHEPVVEVKGATLTALQVVRQPDGRWRAQCVVDV